MALGPNDPHVPGTYVILKRRTTKNKNQQMATLLGAKRSPGMDQVIISFLSRMTDRLKLTRLLTSYIDQMT